MLRRPADKGTMWYALWQPDFIAASVADINFEYLSQQGVKAALIDLDGTVVSRGTYDVDASLSERLRKQPLKVYIATNRPKSRSLKDLKERLNADGVLHPIGIVGKPFPKYYAQAASDHHLQPSELVMIGDRYVQDVFGANLAGLHTVVVHKLGRSVNVVDRILSAIERVRTRRLARKYLAIR